MTETVFQGPKIPYPQKNRSYNRQSEPDCEAMKKAFTIYEKAQREIDANKLWRAKEILQGNLRILGYDHELYLKYGELLEKMGDRVEAGRFLFLSGKSQSESIALYLARHSKKDSHNLLRTFPKAARLDCVEHYPAPVSRKLKELGIKTADLYQCKRQVSHYKESFSDKLLSLGCIGGLIWGVIWGAIGLYMMCKWFIDYIKLMTPP